MRAEEMSGVVAPPCLFPSFPSYSEKKSSVPSSLPTKRKDGGGMNGWNVPHGFRKPPSVGKGIAKDEAVTFQLPLTTDRGSHYGQ
ncbi:hypothetical protein NPIL_635721 [Nephila pilipes]|uniref:Uncharacterized protein n=1 Tax=Nephila pilipes TaxID=299642 RepID=A0A8X6MG79_NEPPI|nr:hypothetical protein NPIL_635721 [Nephila pilipes]